MVSKPWEEATELNEKIEDLLEQAQNTGWWPNEDGNFQQPDVEHAFKRPDAPSSIITYLNGVLSSDKDQSQTKQRGPNTTELTAGGVWKS